MTATVKSNASFYWKQVFSYDNPNDKDTIVQTYEAKVTRHVSFSSAYEKIHTEAKTQGTTVSVGMNFDITGFDILGGGIHSDYETQSTISVSDEIKKSISTTEDVNTETTVTCYWPVSPLKKLEMFQLCFIAPGIYEDFNVFSTSDKTPINIPIEYYVTPKQYVQKFQVIYGNQPSQIPSNVVQEFSLQDPDINRGYGGNYVWLEAVWTAEVNQAATAFQFVKQGDADPNRPNEDLARGAGGSYRYLIPLIQPGFDKRIVEVKLFRSSDVIRDFPGFDGHTTDINEGRKGDYLYLGWKFAKVILA
eukprot:gene7445-8030_t